MRKKYLQVGYRATNESIKSVLTGLDIQPEDNVLSICGSGDIPFAIAEMSPRRILAVDNCTFQIEYAKDRLEALLDRRLFDFLDVPIDLVEYFNDRDSFGFIKRRERFSRAFYFLSHPLRLKRIVKNLSKIEFREGDIFELDTDEKFSKIYLSNAIPRRIATGRCEHNINDVNCFYENIRSYMAPGAKVYACCMNFSLDNLFIDKESTRLASETNNAHWHPIVYKADIA